MAPLPGRTLGSPAQATPTANDLLSLRDAGSRVPWGAAHPVFSNDSHTDMPTYTYRREDGSTFEYKQPITDDPLEECPETGQPVERVITDAPGVVFEGDGFHTNDYDDAQNPGVG